MKTKKYPVSSSKTEILSKKHIDTLNKTLFKFVIHTNVDFAVISYYRKTGDLHLYSDKNLSYYYYRLPPFIFLDKFIQPKTGIKYENEGIEQEFYEDKIIYKNIKNGYLESSYHTANKVAIIEIALFKTSKNKDIIVINKSSKGILELLELDIKNNTWDSPSDLLNGSLFSEIQEKSEGKSGLNVFFKLPEYGTTILACEDTARVLKDPEKFWADKQQNHPEQIIRIDWDMEKGKFYVKE